MEALEAVLLCQAYEFFKAVNDFRETLFMYNRYI